MMLASSIYFAPDWPKRLLSAIPSFQYIPKPIKNNLKTPSWNIQKGILFGLSLYALTLVITPLRHFVIPGNVHWTEEGHRYSWHMKLRGKSGVTRFYAQDADTNERFQVDVDGFVEEWQANKMDGKPYMIWEFAQHLKDEFRIMGSNVEIYVDAWASLNGRAYQQLIAPNFDITQVPKPWFGKADWIFPLNTPLENQR